MSEAKRIGRDEFLQVYVPMAVAGETALAIANKLGVEAEADDKLTADEKKAQFVSQKASNYRQELRAAALAIAESQELDQEATDALVKQYAEKLPKLSKRTRAASDMVSFLDDLLAKCDQSEETTSEPNPEETPE